MTRTPFPSAHIAAISPYHRARHRLRIYVSGHPLRYLSFTRHKYTRHDVGVIGPDTELVIDGSTRSATTFAVYSFQLSQDRPVRLAHHLYAPAQLGVVIRQLNARFDTHFAELTHSDVNVRECLEFCRLRETDSPTLLGFESGLVTRDQVRGELQSVRAAIPREEPEAWVPSAERERAKEALRDQWLQPSLAQLRDRAELVHQEFLVG